MRDILKPHSGTPSGTGVSLSKILDFDDFFVRGRKSEPQNIVYSLKKKS